MLVDKSEVITNETIRVRSRKYIDINEPDSTIILYLILHPNYKDLHATLICI